MMVRILWNDDPTGRRFMDGYKPEHAQHMKLAWEGPFNDNADSDDTGRLEHLFMVFNRDDRPNGRTAPSLSVGDLVFLDVGTEDERVYSCDPQGWTRREWAPPRGS